MCCPSLHTTADGFAHFILTFMRSQPNLVIVYEWKNPVFTPIRQSDTHSKQINGNLLPFFPSLQILHRLYAYEWTVFESHSYTILFVLFHRFAGHFVWGSEFQVFFHLFVSIFTMYQTQICFYSINCYFSTHTMATACYDSNKKHTAMHNQITLVLGRARCCA